MPSTLAGLVAGLLGAIVTGAAAATVTDEPLSATVVWAKYLGDGVPAGYERRGAVVHAVYGALAGVVFAWLAGAFGLATTTPGSAVLWAVVWAAVLWVVAVGVWLRTIVGAEVDGRTLAEEAGGHLLYGVALGFFVFLLSGV